MDNDMSGGKTGTVYDYGFRIYDTRIAKFLSVDPLTKGYPMLTPYQFASNTPLMGVDKDGLELEITITAEHWIDRLDIAIRETSTSPEAAAAAVAVIAMSKTLDDLPSNKAKNWAQNGGGWVNGKPGIADFNGDFEGIKINYTSKNGVSNSLHLKSNLNSITEFGNEMKNVGTNLQGTGGNLDFTIAFGPVGCQIETGLITLPIDESVGYKHTPFNGMELDPLNKSASYLEAGAAAGLEVSAGMNSALYFSLRKDKMQFGDFNGDMFNINVGKPTKWGKIGIGPSGSIGLSKDFTYGYIQGGFSVGFGSASGSMTETGNIKEINPGGKIPEAGYLGGDGIVVP